MGIVEDEAEDGVEVAWDAVASCDEVDEGCADEIPVADVMASFIFVLILL